MKIISLDKLKRSVRKVRITPDYEFNPDFIFLIDFDGDEILNNIKNKLENNIKLTEYDAYLFSVIPFTTHKQDTTEFIIELCNFVNEIEIQEEYKYIIKLSQILWVNALIKNEKLREKLIGVIKMKSTFIQDYEKNLVETAVDKAVKTAEDETLNKIVEKMKKENYSPKEILKITGVNIIMK